MPPRRSASIPLRRIYFRNDRLVLPKVRLPARPIAEHDGWCDDPRSPTYNRLVHVPNEWSAEKMWREDGLYDLVVVVGYNDDPPEGEWGSAIFLHIAREDYAATQGLRRLLAGRSAGAGAAARTRDTRLRVSHPPPTRRQPRLEAERKSVRGFRRKGLVIRRV